LTRQATGNVWAFSVSASVVLADRFTKMAAEAWLDPIRPLPVIPGLFDLTLVRNPGGVFGIMRDLSPGIRSALFTIVPALVIVAIAVYLWRLPGDQRLVRAALALVLGGAAGNLIDRIRLGHVVDFLDVYWRDHHWPAFNIADSAICVGVGLMLFEGIFARPEKAGGRPAPADERPPAAKETSAP